jgi:hypothetical protein
LFDRAGKPKLRSIPQPQWRMNGLNDLTMPPFHAIPPGE